MSQPNPQRPDPVTLEDLLRLKRHERPGAEHWARFDRELNAKVWAALANPPAEERPGILPGWLARGWRWMSVGAVATLAVIFASPGFMASESVKNVAPAIQPNPVVAATTPAAPIAVASVPMVRAAQLAATTDSIVPVSSGQMVYATADLPSTVGNSKVPATLSFPALQSSGEHYADLNAASFASHWHGTY